MTSMQPLPSPGAESPRGAAPPGEAAETMPGQGLVPASPALERNKPLALSPLFSRLPVEVDVVLPVREFRVRNLLALAPGQVIESQWGQTDDVPLSAGNVRLAWSEFEVMEARLAVRVTRLA